MSKPVLEGAAQAIVDATAIPPLLHELGVDGARKVLDDILKASGQREVATSTIRVFLTGWLAKESNGAVIVAAASSWVANTLMLFSVSIVNVFILSLLFPRSARS